MSEYLELSSSLEDYLECIYSLCKEHTHAHVTDIAASLSLSKPSVHRAVAQLRELELVMQEPYGQVTLTEAGAEVAKGILRRHTLMKRFLTDLLGVENETAEAEACGVEHAISRDTADKLSAFLTYMLEDSEIMKRLPVRAPLNSK